MKKSNKAKQRSKKWFLHFAEYHSFICTRRCSNYEAESFTSFKGAKAALVDYLKFYNKKYAFAMKVAKAIDERDCE